MLSLNTLTDNAVNQTQSWHTMVVCRLKLFKFQELLFRKCSFLHSIRRANDTCPLHVLLSHEQRFHQTRGLASNLMRSLCPHTEPYVCADGAVNVR